MTKNTVATLDVRLAILEQKHEELLQLCAEMMAYRNGDAQYMRAAADEFNRRISAIEDRPVAAPVAATPAAPLTLSKEERVRRIKVLMQQNPKQRSFSPQEILAVA